MGCRGHAAHAGSDVGPPRRPSLAGVVAIRTTAPSCREAEEPDIGSDCGIRAILRLKLTRGSQRE